LAARHRTLLLCLAATGLGLMLGGCPPAPPAVASAPEQRILTRWPATQAAELERVMARFAHREPPAFAVFDADETIWQHDLEEALLPFLEAQGRIRLEGMDPGLLPLAPNHGESLTSYYLRLCALDESVGFLWLGQAFAGLSLAELGAAVRAMMASSASIATTVSNAATASPLELHAPRIYQRQVELIRALRAHGIDVYVVTACLEELARMVLSDPAYGIELPPENVVGLRVLLRRPDGTVLAGWPDAAADAVTRQRQWLDPVRQQLRLTTHLAAIPTWYAGKVAAIQSRIAPAERPALVVGDSASDFFMFFYADVAAGGARLFVRRDEARWQNLQRAIRARAYPRAGTSSANPGPELGWITVEPGELGPAP
jgi:phosphorylcholine phosphatase